MFKDWFKFTNRDLVVIAILVAVGAVFSTIWSTLINSAQILGPFTPFFAALGFNIWSFAGIYFIRKPGAGVVPKTIGAVVELMLGNPVGPIVLFYGFAEGIAADLAFVLFGRKITLNMLIVGSLLAHFITLPVDMYRDQILFNLTAILAYSGAATVGKVWNAWLIYWILKLADKAGLRPVNAPAIADETVTA